MDGRLVVGSARAPGGGTRLGLRFTVLGPVEVSADGRQLPGAAPRHRAVLAYLLLHARTVISADRLIGAVWGLTPPETARAQIHGAATAIRRVLRDAGAGDLLATRAAGYVILPEPWQLDLDEFTSRIAAAQTAAADDPAAAATQIRAALALWRGAPLGDVNADYVSAARIRLDDRRLGAVERLADLELSLGRHEDLIDELAAEVAEHPLRERLAGQLMLALYRAGRQADALSIARTFRATLAEQQGLDPGRAFLTLEHAILRDDPSLEAPGLAPPAAVPTPADQEPATNAPLASAGSDDAPLTRQPRRANFLPYDPPDFAGRTVELDQLAQSGSGVVTLVAIDGMAGIGKTALAIHAAHRLADRYPNGQLFIDLKGHTAGQAPIEAGAALETLLRQLGVPPARIPTSVTDRAALWRAELVDRTVVAVLDNAADIDHIRPLLPGASNSLILITSRRRLTDLDGAQALSVDLLPATDAVNLFTRIVGERAAAQPLAVLDVLQLCGFLPLAVRIAAARLQHRPQWTVDHLADRLRDQRRILTELSTTDRGVAAAFALSYQHLDADQRQMFRLLGLHPGHDIDAHAAAALAGVSVQEADLLLEGLLDAHVLQQHQPGRYTFHDLLREHARGTATAEETPHTRHDALTRLFDHYLYTSATAIDLLFPYGAHQRPHVVQPATPAVPIGHADRASSWLDAERANLIAAATYAADHDWPAHTGQLATTLRPYLDGQAHHGDALILHTHALRASQRHGDTTGRGRALTDLGWVCWRLGHYEQAHEHSRHALDACRDSGDRVSETRAHNTLGNVYWRRGDHDQAHHHLQLALELCREIGNRVGEAHVLGNLGMIYASQGLYPQARDHHLKALELHRDLGNQGGEARSLDHIGLVYQRQGQYAQAHDRHRQALDLYRRLNNRSDAAEALNGLGEVAGSTNDPAQAVAHHSAALALAREVGNRPQQARAHHGLAHAYRDLGHGDRAREHATQARHLYIDLGVPEADQVRNLLADLG